MITDTEVVWGELPKLKRSPLSLQAWKEMCNSARHATTYKRVLEAKYVACWSHPCVCMCDP